MKTPGYYRPYPYSFDFGIFEIFTTVIFGGIFYFKESMSSADFEGFVDLIELYCINTIHYHAHFTKADHFTGEIVSRDTYRSFWR